MQSFKPTTLYLAQWDILEKYPELRRDLLIKSLWPGRMTWEYVFMGPANTVTGLHNDFPHNWFVQLQGVKEFILFSPDQRQHMCPAAKYDWGATLSDINVSRLPEQVRELASFEKAHGYHARVEAGDALFIPRRTWHSVVSAEPSTSAKLKVCGPITMGSRRPPPRSGSARPGAAKLPPSKATSASRSTAPSRPANRRSRRRPAGPSEAHALRRDTLKPACAHQRRDLVEALRMARHQQPLHAGRWCGGPAGGAQELSPPRPRANWRTSPPAGPARARQAPAPAGGSGPASNFRLPNTPLHRGAGLARRAHRLGLRPHGAQAP
jgi:hypothetical protein